MCCDNYPAINSETDEVMFICQSKPTLFMKRYVFNNCKNTTKILRAWYKVEILK